MSEPLITPEQDRLLLAYEVRRRLQERTDRIAELEHEVEALRAKVARVDALLAYIGEQYGRLLAVHERVVMDTPEDRDLHAQVVETFREAVAALADQDEVSP